MIYEDVSPEVPIRQGDIFIRLPRIEMSLHEIVLAQDDGDSIVAWPDLAQTNDPFNIIVPVRPVAAIVITQDCDTVNGNDITLCEIRDFRDVEGISRNLTSPNA
jgi:hypothetical protein